MFWRKRGAKLEARVAQLEAALGGMRGPELDARITQLDATISGLPLSDLEAQIARLESIVGGTHQSTLGIHQSTLTDHQANLTAHGQALAGQAATLAGHTAWLQAIEQGVAELNAAHSAQLHDLNRWLSSTTQVVTAMSSVPVIPSPELQAIGPQARRIDDHVAIARSLQVWTIMRWLSLAHFEADLLISVILPTRNRRAFLARAIASVLAQSYRKFELIIVDDASADATPEYLATLDDTRIRCLRGGGLGAAAARNIGLQAATGSIITHFDDDNLMDPDWLRGVAWGFSHWPETELLYGARIVEDNAARDGIASGAMPVLDWQPFDRARLETANYIDMNVIAHRANLPGAEFNPDRKSSIDWDFVLRLTGNRTPLELPVIACLYSYDAPDRISDLPAATQENQLVRAQVHTTRPMRVLAHTAQFPLLSETYIEEEMLALRASGAQIAFSSFFASASPYPVPYPLFSTLEEAVAAQDPDVIVVYWLGHAVGELHHLSRIGRPFALRIHSVEFSAETALRVKAHPCCIGIWAFPHHAKLIPDAHVMAPIFMTHDAIPEPAPQRTIIASISAGLPKKNWPLLLDAMNQLAEFDRVIVMARTNGFEDLPDQVTQLAAALPNPVEVKVNQPRVEVFSILSRTSVLIYTCVQDVTFGMPMSIIEAMRAGACVITPDAPEMRDLCGAGYRPYHDAAGIAAHAREIMAGGPAIEQERTTNREWAIAQFCDAARPQIFHDELSNALIAWRVQRQTL